MNRRDCCRTGLAAALGWGMGPGRVIAGPAARPTLPQTPALRVIVDNDLAGDPDGLVALAHQWMSGRARTVLVTTSALDVGLARLAGEPEGRTADKGRQLAQELAGVLRLAAPCPVLTGAEQAGIGAAQVSAAAHAIVAEARRADALPLVLTCGGPLTNVAAALRLDPEIGRRMRLVWIGGALSAGGQPEYNWATDPEAARQVLAHEGLAIDVVPRETYRQVRVSVAELAADLARASPTGRWLHDRYRQLPPFVQLGASITLGDSALIAATQHADAATWRQRPAAALAPQRTPGLQGRRVRCCEQLDVRTLLADLLAQLRLHAPEEPVS